LIEVENEDLMSWEWSSVELMSQLRMRLWWTSCEADEPAVNLRSRDVYTPLGVVLRCLYTSRCKSTHGEPWGSGLEAYFRSAVMITDRKVS